MKIFNRSFALLISAAIISATALSGCIPVMIGAAAVTSVSVAHDRRTVGSLIDDQLIETKAKYFLVTEVQLKGDTHFNVTSVNGVVLLTGETPTAEQRTLAVDIVRDLAQVRQVVNEVQVLQKSSWPDRTVDSWLTSKVKTKLLDTKNLDPTRIKVVTADKNVYLMGLVTRIEGDFAAESARSVNGVHKVIKVFEYIGEPDVN